MTDELEQNNAVSEAVTPEVSQTDEVQKAEQEAQQEERGKKQRENWRALEQRKNDAERTVKMQEEMITRLLAQGQQVAQSPPPDELANISDDDYLKKGDVTRMIDRKAEEKARKIAQEEMAKYHEQQEQIQIPDRLKRQFPDFEDVVNAETLSLLEETDPELAVMIVSSKDRYKIAVQSYKYIKALGIVDKVPSSRRMKEVEKKLEKNEKTLPSPQSFDKRPMAQAFQLTEADKKKLYQEMMGYASQAV